MLGFTTSVAGERLFAGAKETATCSSQRKQVVMMGLQHVRRFRFDEEVREAATATPTLPASEEKDPEKDGLSFDPMELASNIEAGIGISLGNMPSGPNFDFLFNSNAIAGREAYMAAPVMELKPTAESFIATSLEKAILLPNLWSPVSDVIASTTGLAATAAALDKTYDFRVKQESAASKAHHMFKNRKEALAMCSTTYDEGLFTKFPARAEAFVKATKAAMAVEPEYASPKTVEEFYIASCAENASKQSEYSTYGASCLSPTEASDATLLKEAKEFRSLQLSDLQNEGVVYDQKRVGFWMSTSEYEETQAMNYPAVVARE